jgi:hypothetical protein
MSYERNRPPLYRRDGAITCRACQLGLGACKCWASVPAMAEFRSALRVGLGMVPLRDENRSPRFIGRK